LEKNDTQLKRILSGRKVLLPLMLSLIVFVILFRNISFHSFLDIKLNIVFYVAMCGAIGMAMLRDMAYIWRLRLLSNNSISWKKCLQIVLLWEFASALTPSAVGGSVAAVLMLEREKIPLGKSTSIILVTAFLDELVYILVMPILFLLMGDQLFNFDVICPDAIQLYVSSWYGEVKTIVIAIYAFLFLVYVVMFYGLFVDARALKKAYHFLSRISLLSRWQQTLYQAGDDIVIASETFSKKPVAFWMNSFFATFLSWSARYMVAFFVVWAVSGLLPNLIEIYGRQYFIRTLTILPLSPGGIGIAEIAFVAFLCQFMPGQLSRVAALIWRLLSYHIYLILGTIVLPFWLREE
jgi:uncharacterized protein (TIRG00374 family)